MSKAINVLILSNIASITRSAGIKVMDNLSRSHDVTKAASQDFMTYNSVASGAISSLFDISPPPVKVEPKAIEPVEPKPDADNKPKETGDE